MIDLTNINVLIALIGMGIWGVLLLMTMIVITYKLLNKAFKFISMKRIS